MNVGLEALRQSGRLDKAKVVAYKGGQKLVACCPVHRESTPSFAVFDNGGCHCKSCGWSGSFQDLTHILEMELPEDFREQVAEKPLSTSLEPAVLHQAHSIVLAELTLQGAQREALRRRGLNAADLVQLETQGYRSAPGRLSWPTRRRVAAAVVAEMGEDVAQSLPFLEKTQYGWATAGIEGLLVPLWNAVGQVVAFKVRRPNNEPKYLFWKAGGSQASTGAPCHVKRVTGAQLVVVVEGPIKADIVALRWKEVFGETVAAVAIPGASSHKDLAAALSQLGLKRVLLALDQDLAGEKTTEILRPRLVEAGFEVSVASWPKDLGKIDDFILNPVASVQLRRELHQVEEEPAPIALSGPAFKTMAEARSSAKEWLRDRLLGTAGVGALNLEMGGGKTHMTIDLVNELHNTGKLVGQVGFFTQRHEQGEQFPGTAHWAKHYGADYKAEGVGFDKQPTEKTPCRNLGFALRVINSGAPMKTACESCDLRSECAGNLAKNPTEPFYLAQKMTGKELHLYNTNALRDKGLVSKLSTIIIDDTDLEKALVENVTQTWQNLYDAQDWARRNPSYQPMEKLLDAVERLRREIPKPKFEYDKPRLYGKDLQRQLAAQLGGLDNLKAVLEHAVTAQDVSPLDANGNARTAIPHRILLEMARRLLVEVDQVETNPRVSVTSQGVSVWKGAELDFTEKRVLILNAGAGAEQFQRLHPGVHVEVFNGSVELPDRTRVIQHYEGPFTRSKSKELTQLVIEKFKERAAIHPNETPADWGCVSFREVIDALQVAVPGINARYFGNQAGSNELEGVSFFVLAGDHRPNPNGFLEEAQAIYGNSAPINAATKGYHTEHRDKAGNVATVWHCDGYVDHLLDERWQYVSVGENRQAFGRPRPFNTGNEAPEQGSLLDGFSAPQRRLDVCILSSYALPGVTPDELIGAKVAAEADLVATAVELRRNGQVVTQKALCEASGLTTRRVSKSILDRVKLRSEAEFFTLNAALNSTPALNVFREVVFAPVIELRCRMTLTCTASVVDPQRGPPCINSLVPLA